MPGWRAQQGSAQIIASDDQRELRKLAADNLCYAFVCCFVAFAGREKCLVVINASSQESRTAVLELDLSPAGVVPPAAALYSKLQP